MEWTQQDDLDVDMNSEIDSVVASRPELDFDIDDLPQLELDDDYFITEPNGWFDPKFIFWKYANQHKRTAYKVELSSDSESNLTMVNPKLAIPSPPTLYDNDDDCQLDLPKIETHIKEEPSSESDNDELYPHNFDFAIPTNDVDVKFPFKAQKWPTENKVAVKLEIPVKEQLQEHGDEVDKPKPPYSYACLIAMALKNSQNGTLPVSSIYTFICTHFPYFNTAPKGWKNSIRHNLSLNKCFDKIERPMHKERGGLWTMNPEKVAKMDQEVQKWSLKDSSAVKKCMTSPDLLELLERGELKFNDDSSADEESDEDAAVNSLAGSDDESDHEDEDHYIFKDHDYLRLNYTVRAQCVYQPVHRRTPMDVGAAEAFLKIE